MEIADGLYLGQLLFATKHLLSEYDPKLPDNECGYENFGYFLLLDESWANEVRRVFPYIGIPAYEDDTLYHRPEVEQLKAAIAGVTAALETYEKIPICFEGIAPYANWTLDDTERNFFIKYWLGQK